MALIDNHALLDLPDESEPAFDWGEIEAEAAMQVRPPLLLLKEAMHVVYFNQLLGAVCTQKLVKLLFFSRFQPFCEFVTLG